MIETRSDLLPWSTPSQQGSLFTFSKWLAPTKLPCTLFSNILHDLSDHISVAWDIQLDPDELELRYSDLTGDTLGLDFLCSVLGALQAFRPGWCRRQDDGFSSYLFTDFTQPYIMRPACHDLRPCGK